MNFKCRVVICLAAVLAIPTLAARPADASPADLERAFSSLQSSTMSLAPVATFVSSIESFYSRSDVQALVDSHSGVDFTMSGGPPLTIAAGATPDEIARAYLLAVSDSIRTPALLPHTGDPTKDGIVDDFNAIVVAGQAAGANLLIASMVTSDVTRDYVAWHVSDLQAQGVDYPAHLVAEGKADLAQLPFVMTAGLGGIIAGVLSFGAGVATVVCVIAEPCGALVGGVVIGTLTAAAGIAAAIDALASNTQAIVSCVVRVSQVIDYTQHIVASAAVAKCPKTQLQMTVYVQINRKNTSGYGLASDGTGDTCVQTTSCSVGVSLQDGYPIRSCFYSEGNYTASNGLPASGKDYSGAACFVR